MKTWSISTTVRNPERVPDFTAAIQAIVGRPWNKETQVEYMYELIRRRLYRPNNLSEEQTAIYDDLERDMTTAEASEIFTSQNYEDPPMRGRTAMAPVRDMGLVTLQPQVALTDLGKSLIDGGITLQDVLLNFLLKWELPTPDHRTFTAQEGYHIRPFTGTLALIDGVNRGWKNLGHEEVGLSREEFNIFAPTLIDYKNIESYVERILQSRLDISSAKSAAAKLSAFNAAVNHHLLNLPHGSDQYTDTDLNNLRDYGDNAIRYFRNTGFIEFRGAGRYVDISKTSKAQVKLLVDNKLYVPNGYSTLASYLDSIGDVDAFVPPWATESKLIEVKDYLRGLLKAEGIEQTDVRLKTSTKKNVIRGEDAEVIELKTALVDARLNKLKQESREPAFITSFIDEYSELTKKNYSGYLPKPVALEFNTFKTFLSLNDAIAIKPNYPIGDDGEPVSTAPGGGTDLICDYSSFILSVEVTMSTGRNQWVMEGQPVQRHLRDIEESTSKPAFGLFLAPKLHTDTVDTFWIANVHGYQGEAQKIIPLEFAAWQLFLRAVRHNIENGQLKHHAIHKLFEMSQPEGAELQNSLVWVKRINSPEFLKKAAG